MQKMIVNQTEVLTLKNEQIALENSKLVGSSQSINFSLHVMGRK